MNRDLKGHFVIPVLAVRASMKGGRMTANLGAAATFVLAVLLTAPQIVAAHGFETAGSDWGVILEVKPGTKTVVTLLDGKEVKGKLQGVSDTSIVLADGKDTRIIARQDVQAVYRLKKSPWRSARNGASLGARAAAATTRRVWNNPDAGGSFLIVAPVVGVAVASSSIPLAAGGLFAGIFRHYRERIY